MVLRKLSLANIAVRLSFWTMKTKKEKISHSGLTIQKNLGINLKKDGNVREKKRNWKIKARNGFQRIIVPIRIAITDNNLNLRPQMKKRRHLQLMQLGA